MSSYKRRTCCFSQVVKPIQDFKNVASIWVLNLIHLLIIGQRTFYYNPSSSGILCLRCRFIAEYFDIKSLFNIHKIDRSSIQRWQGSSVKMAVVLLHFLVLPGVLSSGTGQWRALRTVHKEQQLQMSSLEDVLVKYIPDYYSTIVPLGAWSKENLEYFCNGKLWVCYMVLTCCLLLFSPSKFSGAGKRIALSLEANYQPLLQAIANPIVKINERLIMSWEIYCTHQIFKIGWLQPDWGEPAARMEQT